MVTIKRTVLVILLLMLPLILGSWVDPSVTDVYNAQIYYVSSDYDVNRLSGRVQFYLNDYDNISLNEGGYLYNAGPSTYSGEVNINGLRYPCRLNSLSELQIQQNYTLNGYTRTTWVNYHCVPDVVPQNFSLPEYALVFVVFVIILILSVSVIGRGVVL